MVQANQSNVLWTVIIVGVVLAVLGAFAWSSLAGSSDAELAALNTKLDATNAKVDTTANTVANLDIPTAAEIAAQVQVASGGTSASFSNTEDVLAGIYPAKVNQLEDDCIDDLRDEYSTMPWSHSDVFRIIKNLIEDSTGQEIKELTLTDWNYGHDYTFIANDLGLRDESTRRASLSNTLQVSYKFVDGEQELQKDRVYVVASCTDWNKVDNYFELAEAEFTL